MVADALSQYQSRTQVDYHFGMHLKEERKPSPAAVTNKPSSSDASPVSETTTSWSKNASSDLLF